MCQIDKPQDRPGQDQAQGPQNSAPAEKPPQRPLSLKEKLEWVRSQPGANPEVSRWFREGSVIIAPVRPKGQAQQQGPGQGKCQSQEPKEGPKSEPASQ